MIDIPMFITTAPIKNIEIHKFSYAHTRQTHKLILIYKPKNVRSIGWGHRVQ